MTASSVVAARPGRLVERIVIKRNNPRLIDVYGHWWVEIDGAESYGWWPSIRPISIGQALHGVPGVLNGIGGPGAGTATLDPRHGEAADHAFHPRTADSRDDDQLIAAVRHFASTFSGAWRWSTGPAVNCRSFQNDLLAAAGLAIPDGYAHTAGGGCPFLASPRRWRQRATALVQMHELIGYRIRVPQERSRGSA